MSNAWDIGFEKGEKEAIKSEIEFLEKICDVKNSDYRAIKERIKYLKFEVKK